MASRKTPVGLSEEQLAEYKQKTQISNHATRSDKTAWQRQFTNLQKLVTKLEPIEDKILSLIAEKDVIVDELITLRGRLVNECIHPFEHLIVHEGVVVCKFCERKMVVSENAPTEEKEYSESVEDDAE